MPADITKRKTRQHLYRYLAFVEFFWVRRFAISSKHRCGDYVEVVNMQFQVPTKKS
jgi:hypothetical protein